MNSFWWILLSTLLMSLISWVGLIFFAVREQVLRRVIPLLISFAAGSLLGGAFLHLIPETVRESGPTLSVFVWILVGFGLFLLMEQYLSWHHSHRRKRQVAKPVTFLILLADGLHNFIGGLAIGGSFLISPRVGWITWIAAAAHEFPQEFGDFGILIHGGWKKRWALLFNFVSALSIVPGGLAAYWLEGHVDVVFLLPFAAGNFLYISASDLIPEIKHSGSLGQNFLTFTMFTLGILLILLTRLFS